MVYDMAKAINEFGYLAIFLASLAFAVITLWKLNKQTNDKLTEAMTLRMKDNLEMYKTLLEKQEEQCREENRMLQVRIQQTEEELRSYKTEDKKLLASFVQKLSQDNMRSSRSIKELTAAINGMISQLKKG